MWGYEEIILNSWQYISLLLPSQTMVPPASRDTALHVLRQCFWLSNVPMQMQYQPALGMSCNSLCKSSFKFFENITAKTISFILPLTCNYSYVFLSWCHFWCRTRGWTWLQKQKRDPYLTLYVYIYILYSVLLFQNCTSFLASLASLFCDVPFAKLLVLYDIAARSLLQCIASACMFQLQTNPQDPSSC